MEYLVPLATFGIVFLSVILISRHSDFRRPALTAI